MSVYRSGGPTIRNDFIVQATERVRAPDALSGVARYVDDPPAPPQDFAFLRKAQPLNAPWPAAFKWMARLPEDARPMELMRVYPRIVNQLALYARNPAAFRIYLFDLLVDKRGGRRGFPAPIVAELLRLRQHFDSEPGGL